ncbi:MAG TPA: DUF3460 family protein [Burkholderiaceae bacterium]|nr:DUF3460 family protein [Burkholderiaceae bacterium]
MYESDVTQFLKRLKQERPEIDEDQRRGRAIWWDKSGIDLDELQRQKHSRVPQSPYVYYSKP